MATGTTRSCGVKPEWLEAASLKDPHYERTTHEYEGDHPGCRDGMAWRRVGPRARTARATSSLPAATCVSACVGGGQGQQPGLDERTRIRRLSFTFLVFSLVRLSPLESDLLEVGISGHGADRCDQDDEIYLMVQEIWSGSEILGVERFGGSKMRQRADYETTGWDRGDVNRPCPRGL